LDWPSLSFQAEIKNKEAPEGTSLFFIEGSPVYDGFGQMGVQTTFSCNGFLLPPS